MKIRKLSQKAIAMLITIMMLVSMMAVPVSAAEGANPPTEGISAYKQSNNNLRIYSTDKAWIENISGVSEEGNALDYTANPSHYGYDSKGQSYGSYAVINIPDVTKANLSLVISAEGYKDLQLDLTIGGYNYGLGGYTVTVDEATIIGAEDPTDPTDPSDEDKDDDKVVDTDKPVYADGTYTGTAPVNGFGYDARVTVTVKDGKITSVDISNSTTNSTNEGFLNRAANGMASAFVGKTAEDTLAVDTVSRATYSSNAINEAVGNALADALKQTTPDDGGKTDPSTPSVDGNTLTIDNVNLSVVGGRWAFTFPAEYAAGITEVLVNDTPWEAQSYAPYTGGKYFLDQDNNRFIMAATAWTTDNNLLKSGDVITVKSNGYNDFSFKFVRSNDDAYITANDGKGDPLKLHLKLEGSFEAAIVGQADYDGVSAATGMVSTYSNSNASVYGALTEKNPTASDWKSITDGSLNIDGNTYATAVKIEAADGSDKDSGMTGSLGMLSNAVTLSGTPTTPGTYKVTVTLKDNEGREATSNALTFTVYPQDTKLADRLVTENFVQTEDGKYMWMYQEPWFISQFGSNVAGENESVRVPKDLKAWLGSGEDGPYADLGYDIPWEDVTKGKYAQTLYIPAGCNLTMTNIKVHSSVRIIVEEGATLNLIRSTVEGVIDVQKGGTFSMNYRDGEFTSGAIVNGQVILEDGAILENAAIVSHTNYLANGDLTDRNNSAPVVVAKGNTTVKGNVFIRGDEAGSSEGQTGLLVTNGTLTLEDDATLAVYGGAAKTTLYQNAGTALTLDNGNIAGNGKLIAVGGAAYAGDGGNGVTGSGTISTTEAFLQGTTALSDGLSGKPQTPGTAVSEGVNVTSKKKHIEDGTSITLNESLLLEGGDPLYDLYWHVTEAAPRTDVYDIDEPSDPVDPNPDPDPVDPDDSDKNNDKKRTGGGGGGGGAAVLSTYTLTFNTNGGSTIDAVKKTSGATVTLADYTTTREGYTFDGWYTDEALTKAADAKVSMTENVTVYAKWTATGAETPQNNAGKFVDVSANDYFNDAVNWAVDNGITSGMDATHFAPNGVSTRAQAVTMLWRQAGEPAVSDVENPFTDVSADDYFYQAVLWAVNEGIVSGTSATTFSPDMACSRAHIVSILHRAAGEPEATGNSFVDVAADAYYAGAVNWAVAENITAGVDATHFAPDASCTRAQIISFLYRQNA